MGRMITSNIWEDDFIVSLSFFNRLVWIGLITIADDQGRLQDSANLIRSKMFPMDDVSLKDIEGALVEFCKADKITRYIADNKKLIQIVHWWKHQTPRWASKSIYQPPPEWIDRVRCHITGNKLLTVNWDSEGGYIANYIAGNTTPYVNDNVNDDVKVKDDDDIGARNIVTDIVASMQDILETVTGLPVPPTSFQVVEQLIAMNATKDDIQAAYNWYRGQGRQFKYHGSLVGPTQNAMSKRLAKTPTTSIGAGYSRVGED